ncbi:MAG: tyrosine-type recombinase/integrase [Pirellulales bacterium]
MVAPKRNVSKPSKPHADFPLFAHSSGQWAKKLAGRIHYFGRWDDPKAALEKWLDEKDDLLAGREPRMVEGCTLRELCNRFMNFKAQQRDAGDISERMWQDYFVTCRTLMEVFRFNPDVENLRPDDFQRLRAVFAETHGPVRLSSDIIRTRTVFKWGLESGLFDRPLRFGPSFKPPSRATLRRHRAKRGAKMFSDREIRMMLLGASVPLRAMILLGINCGLGNHDCVELRTKHLDLDNGWLDFPRPKTGVQRRCPLWPETIHAVRYALRFRPKPQEQTDRVFLTQKGNDWGPKSVWDNPIAKETTKVTKALGIHRKGVGFYALRHTFQTIGGRSRDLQAVREIMGHADAANDMAATYTEERVDDDRLRAVVDYVRAWLFRGGN